MLRNNANAQMEKPIKVMPGTSAIGRHDDIAATRNAEQPRILSVSDWPASLHTQDETPHAHGSSRPGSLDRVA